MTDHLLTKSTFLQAIRCHKLLYLDEHHPELGAPLDDVTKRRLTEGQQVHGLARGLFPDGIEARAADPLDLLTSLERTEELLRTDQEVLFEAAFQEQEVFAFVDILEKGENGWSLYEVKSATSVKDHYLWDVALQVYLVRSAGMNISRAFLVHIDSEYQRLGDLDPQGLFSLEPVLESCEPLMEFISAEIEQAKQVLKSGSVPAIDIGPYCEDPDDCRFKSYCWRHVPEPSVFDVYYLSKKAKFDLYRRGILEIDDIPVSFPMQARSRFHVQHHRHQATRVDVEGLERFLARLRFPVHYFDFETFTTAIPPYDGVSPYQHIPFQFSLHLQEHAGKEPSHHGFLASADTDPRLELAAALLETCQGEGSVVVYFARFERGVLQQLAADLPELAEPLLGLEERLVDLRDPFSQRHLYLPAMGGSLSLKSVLPALVPSLSYAGLPVADGMQAMEIYRQLSEIEEPAIVEQQRNALWEYCKLDTWAMVEIVRVLRRIVEGPDYVEELL